MDKNFLNKVYGYNKIKNELFLIREWHFKSDLLKDKKRFLPRGIIFYGAPGTGKTHITREYASSFNRPIFVIEGDSDNVLEEVVSIYEEAKTKDKAIVIIDEIDKLIEKDSKLTRILMSQLDGFNTSINVLTLATCNHYGVLPEEMVRPGRFDRQFKVMIDSKEDLNEIIRLSSKDAKLSFSEDEFIELEDVLENQNVITIRTLFHNAALKFNNKVSLQNILDTLDFIETGFVKENYEIKVSKEEAIHEAGHALYVELYAKQFKFLRIYFSKNRGATVTKCLSNIKTIENEIQNIEICLAGMIAENLILKKHSLGIDSDLEKAFEKANNLVNKKLINGINYRFEDNYGNYASIYSDKRRSFFEKKTLKFIKKHYKIVKKRLSKHKKELLKVRDYLMTNKKINRNELIKILD